MSDAREPRRVGRSIVAVLAGILVGAVLSIGTDVALHAAGIFPPIGQWAGSSLFAIATGYRTVYNVVGSYLIARLAPNRPMGHALVGGFLGVVVTLVGAAATWNHEPSLGPHWYPIALVILALPCAWAGGKLRMIQQRNSPLPRTT
jgi:peptidoglycan/LPS O-acetylase OafA/YrhL